MGIIILITVVVFAISMYDFLASRKWQQVTSDLRNDVVFDNRNKSYGAYQIRRNYDRNLILIMFGLLFSVGIIAGAIHFFSDNTLVKKEVIIPIDDPFLIKPDDVVIKMDFDKKEVVKPSGNAGPTIRNIPLIISDDDQQPTEEVPTQEELEGSSSGTSTANPTGAGFGTGTTGEGTGGNAIDNDDSDVIIDIAQFDAEFPGGIAEMNRFLSTKIRYPESALASGKQGKVYLRFVVGKEGAVENVTVVKGIVGCPECDAEALRVVKMMPKWKPAKHNGKVVKSYFNLPIIFQIK